MYALSWRRGPGFLTQQHWDHIEVHSSNDRSGSPVSCWTKDLLRLSAFQYGIEFILKHSTSLIRKSGRLYSTG